VEQETEHPTVTGHRCSAEGRSFKEKRKRDDEDVGLQMVEHSNICTPFLI
jgi:hypothetical protein